MAYSRPSFPTHRRPAGLSGSGFLAPFIESHSGWGGSGGSDEGATQWTGTPPPVLPPLPPPPANGLGPSSPAPTDTQGPDAQIYTHLFPEADGEVGPGFVPIVPAPPGPPEPSGAPGGSDPVDYGSGGAFDFGTDAGGAGQEGPDPRISRAVLLLLGLFMAQ